MLALLVTACSPNTSCPLGSGRSVPASVFAIEGVVTRVPMSFPAPTKCELPEGTLAASGTFTDAQGREQPLLIDSLSHDTRSGSVNLAVVLPATAPGSGAIKLFVDPQLGIAFVPVEVARDGTQLPSTDERVGCLEPQRTATGLVVCVDGGVDVRRAGQPVAWYEDGFGAQVVGEVVWLQRRGDGGTVFERYLAEADGGLVASHRGVAPGARSATLRFAEADRVMTLGLTALTSPDGGLEFLDTPAGNTAETVLAEADTAWRWVTDRWCATDGGCLPGGSRGKLAGMEREVWWEFAAPQLLVHRRPVADAGAFASVPLPAGATFTTRRADLFAVRRPLWNDPREGQFLFQWRTDGGGLLLTHFPDLPERWQGPGVIAFGLDGGVVRFYEL